MELIGARDVVAVLGRQARELGAQPLDAQPRPAPRAASRGDLRDQPALGRRSVAARAAGLLVELLERRRQAEMRGEAHVGAVHAEAERARRAEEAAAAGQELLGGAALLLRPRLPIDAARRPAGERRRVDALRPRQLLGHARRAQRAVHARAEHDAGPEAAVGDEPRQQLAGARQVVGRRAEPDAEREVPTRRARAHARRRAKAERSLRLRQRPRRGAPRRGRQRGDAAGSGRPIAQARAERAVGRAPIVAAPRGALRLVDGDERDARGLDRAAQGAAERPGVQALGRGQRDEQAPRGQLRQRPARRFGIVAGEQSGPPDARLREAPALVAQQRAQRRDDQGRPRGEEGREMEDQRLARARGKREHEVASREQRGDAVGLAGPQTSRPEEPARESLERAVVADERRRLELERVRLGRLAAVQDPGRAPSRLDLSRPGDEQRAAFGRRRLRVDPRELAQQPFKVAPRRLGEPARLVRRERAQPREVGLEPRGQARGLGRDRRGLQPVRGGGGAGRARAEAGAQLALEVRRRRDERAAVQQPPGEGAREAPVLRLFGEGQRPARPGSGVLAEMRARRAARGRGGRAGRLQDDLHPLYTERGAI